jgi:hypothetical protein
VQDIQRRLAASCRNVSESTDLLGLTRNAARSFAAAGAIFPVRLVERDIAILSEVGFQPIDDSD